MAFQPHPKPQPDFTALSNHLISAAQQVKLIPKLPAFQALAAIMAQMTDQHQQNLTALETQHQQNLAAREKQHQQDLAAREKQHQQDLAAQEMQHREIIGRLDGLGERLKKIEDQFVAMSLSIS